MRWRWIRWPSISFGMPGRIAPGCHVEKIICTRRLWPTIRHPAFSMIRIILRRRSDCPAWEYMNIGTIPKIGNTPEISAERKASNWWPLGSNDRSGDKKLFVLVPRWEMVRNSWPSPRRRGGKRRLGETGLCGSFPIAPILGWLTSDFSKLGQAPMGRYLGY